MNLVLDGRRIIPFWNQVTAILNENDVISGDKGTQGREEGSQLYEHDSL